MSFGNPLGEIEQPPATTRVTYWWFAETGFFGWLERLVSGEGKPGHVGVSFDDRYYEAVGTGVRTGELPTDFMAKLDVQMVEPLAAEVYATGMVGKKYGWWTLAADWLQARLGLRLPTADDQPVCSEFCANTAIRGGVLLPSGKLVQIPYPDRETPWSLAEVLGLR